VRHCGAQHERRVVHVDLESVDVMLIQVVNLWKGGFNVEQRRSEAQTWA
jgi:hypothetical protein